MNRRWRSGLVATAFAAGVLGASWAARAVTVQDTVAFLAANGYTVVSVEVSDDGKTFEVKAVFNGAQVELFVDAATGVVTVDDAGEDRGGDGASASASDDPSPSTSASGDDPSDDLSDSDDPSASDPSASASDPSASDPSASASDPSASDPSASASDPSDSSSDSDDKSDASSDDPSAPPAAP